MRNLNIRRTNHYFRKKDSCQLFLLSAGCYAPMWSAAYSHKARVLLICHHMQIASLDSLAQQTLQFKDFKKMDCKTQAGSRSYWDQWQASHWLQWEQDRISLFWKQNPAVFGLFGAHAALKVCSCRATKIFPICLIPWQHITIKLSILKWDFTTKPEDLYKCKKILLSCNSH